MSMGRATCPSFGRQLWGLETDLSVRTQIEELPMLPEFPSPARVSEYICNPKYLFS